MKAHVLPLPFVPATWMIFRALISASYRRKYHTNECLCN